MNYIKKILFLVFFLPTLLFAQDYAELANEFAKTTNDILNKKSFTIIDASFEAGDQMLVNLYDPSKSIKISLGRSGGMGTVVPPTAAALVAHAKARDIDLKMNLVAPYLSATVGENNIDKLLEEGFVTKANSLTVVVEGVNYNVDAFVGKTTYGGKQFILSCPELWDNYF